MLILYRHKSHLKISSANGRLDSLEGKQISSTEKQKRYIYTTDSLEFKSRKLSTKGAHKILENGTSHEWYIQQVSKPLLIKMEFIGKDTLKITDGNVYIIDTLSQYLDISTLQVLFATHNFQVSQRQMNGQTILRFDFPEILLPDSSSAYNKGYIVYQLKTKSNLPIGTKIENTAYIYFDSNAAVVTNTVVNERVENTVGIEKVENQLATIQLYPNPANTELNVWFRSASVKEFYVADMTGKRLAHYKVNSALAKIDLSRFASGSYLLIVNDKGKWYSSKVFVKQ